MSFHNKPWRMTLENQLLVTNEPVEVQDFPEIYRTFYWNVWNLPQSNEEGTSDHDMKPVGLGNTWILTGVAQNSSWTLP